MGYWRERVESLGDSLKTEREYSRGLRETIDQANRRHEEELAAQAESLKAGFVEETRRSNAATAERTRQETLEIVLSALDLPGYRADGGFSVRIGLKPEYPTDRFWADLNTDLEVRAERKAADERAATEAKIAELNKRESKNLDLHDLDDVIADLAIDLRSEIKPKKGGKK